MDYIKRCLEEKLKTLFETYKVVLVTGARQVGKTRLINETYKDISYVNLDDYDKEMMAKEDGKRFLDINGLPLKIDEVQRVPEIFRTIKLYVDKNDSYGQYILSGSQLFKLMEEASDSLSGRVAILELSTLSIREIYGISFNERFLPTSKYIEKRRKDKKLVRIDIWDNIFNGFYPEMQNKKKTKEEFYNFYVRTYLERDVREIVNVQNLDLFYKFMICVAARTGQLINYTNISNEIGVDADTIKKWISVLETSNIIYVLRPYANTELRKALKTPKIYFRDTGLCSYLTSWLSKDTLMKGAMSGPIYETFIISEIIKSYANLGIDYRKYLSFYNGRDNKKETQAEIDLIIEENNTLYPIEIKTKTNPNEDDIKNFNVLEKVKNKKIGEGAVICQAKEDGFINSKVNIIPDKYI